MNRVELIGRLTRDPELRYTGSNIATTRFTLAVNRPFQSQNGEQGTDFINIVVWRKQAENVKKYCSKGSLVAVEGRIQTGSYEKDGQRVYTTDVVADSVQFLERREGAVSNEEMDTLVNHLFACSDVNHTPDGKTILSILPQQDIERLMG